jgi:hypothetical protein
LDLVKEFHRELGRKGEEKKRTLSLRKRVTERETAVDRLAMDLFVDLCEGKETAKLVE